jgi:hypothetical protein
MYPVKVVNTNKLDNNIDVEKTRFIGVNQEKKFHLKRLYTQSRKTACWNPGVKKLTGKENKKKICIQIISNDFAY